MNGYQELTIGKAMAYAAPAAGTVAAATVVQDTHATLTFLGMSSDEWALAGFVLAAIYSALMILLTLPRVFGFVRHHWRRLVGLFGRSPSDDDQAGADRP
jgi:uncharacterized membrane protein